MSLTGTCSVSVAWPVLFPSEPGCLPDPLATSAELCGIISLSVGHFSFCVGQVLFCLLLFPSFKVSSVAAALPFHISPLSSACFFCISSRKSEVLWFLD